MAVAILSVSRLSSKSDCDNGCGCGCGCEYGRACVSVSLLPFPFTHLRLRCAPGLVGLQTKNGVFRHVQHASRGGVKSKSSSYMSESSQREMLKALAAAARGVDMGAVRASQYIGLILDESTGVVNKSQIVFYYRYVFKGRAKAISAGFRRCQGGAQRPYWRRPYTAYEKAAPR